MKKFLAALLALPLCLGALCVVAASENGLSYGDASGDGIVNSLDAAQVLKHDAQLITLSAEAVAASDVNGDGIVNSLDAAQVLKYDAELIEYFPVEQPYAPDTEPGFYASMLPEATDMNGREFYTLQRWFGYGNPNIDFQGEVIWEDDEDGTMTGINLAKKKVLDEVQAAYNCTITGEMSTDNAGSIRTMLQEDILGGTAEYDFCFESYYYYAAFAEDGLLVDLNDLGIDFANPWWDQNAVADLSVCNKLFYALGDINTYDNDGTYVLYFNEDLYERNGGDVQALYDMAFEGEWTFEELESIVTGFGYDANADGVRDEFDTYGLLTETANLYTHMLAGGNKLVDKNSNDEPVFSLASGDGYEALNDAVDLYMNSDDVLVADLDYYMEKYYGEDVYEKTVNNAFKEGRGLFHMTSLLHLNYFSDMEDDFGILPVPKYSRENERYYHYVSPFVCSTLFVPVGENSRGEKGEQLGMIIDALGAYSKDYVTPAYYEKRVADNPDSTAVLDLVFASRTYDLGRVFGSKWNTDTLTENLDYNTPSRVEAQKDLIELYISNTVNKIKENSPDTDNGNAPEAPDTDNPEDKTNYALGASYTISKNFESVTLPDDASTMFLHDGDMYTCEKWGDVDFTRLTDGITAKGEDMDSLGAVEGVTVSFVGTRSPYEFVIDLGETKTDISSVVFCGVRDGVANGQSRGFDVNATLIYTSDIVGEWSAPHSTSFSSEEIENAPLIYSQSGEHVESFTYTFTLDAPASGRYVRIITASPVYVLQFDEIMVLN